MTDIETAIKKLDGHSVCLCRFGEIITKNGRGISPLLDLIAEYKKLDGYSCADLIIGKAAAMLMVKLGVKEVYGKVMSYPAVEVFKEYGIPFCCGTLTDKIINRQGTDICPMEKTVAGIDGIEDGYRALVQAVEFLKKELL